MKIKPIGNKVLIEVLKIEKKTTSGIVLSTNDRIESQNVGVVLAIGTIDEPIKVGDKVFFELNSGFKISKDSKELLILSVENILAILN